MLSQDEGMKDCASLKNNPFHIHPDGTRIRILSKHSSKLCKGMRKYPHEKRQAKMPLYLSPKILRKI
jgi:hypothetical protein